MPYSRSHAKTIISNLFVSRQNGLCAICKRKFDTDNHPELDHCHKSGLCRAVLCGTCNCGLGLFKDSTGNLLAALAYLQADYSGNPPHPDTEQFDSWDIESLPNIPPKIGRPPKASGAMSNAERQKSYRARKEAK